MGYARRPGIAKLAFLRRFLFLVVSFAIVFSLDTTRRKRFFEQRKPLFERRYSILNFL